MSGDEEGRRTLEARLQNHHGVSLEQVLGEVRYLRDDGDSVIAGGSLAYGLGNRLSDLDLVVVGSSTAHSSRVPLEHFVGSLRVDVWKLARDLVEATFERAEQALAFTGELHDSFGEFDQETEPKLLHRIAHGVLVDGGGLDPAPDRDYAALASGLVVRDYAERMRSSALVARLSLAAGRPLAAVVNARRAVEEALGATVADRGLPFSGDKWLGERLAAEAADLAPLHEPFRRLPDEPARGAESFVESALSTCASLWGVDLGLEVLTGLASWRSSGPRLAEVGEERFLLSVRHGAIWSLDAEEAEAWRGLAGAGGAEEEGATWRLDDCGCRAASLCLRLYEHGLLDLAWVNGLTVEDLEAARAAA
jgi:hypothetical protein